MTQKKPQKAKPNRHVQRVQGIRRSGAAGFHKAATDYNRRPKHKNKGWDSE